jgi:serine/threonine-protein kinase RsbW
MFQKINQVAQLPFGTNRALLMSMARKFRLEVKDMADVQAHNIVPHSFHSTPYVEVRQSFRSQVQAISPFIEQLMRFILKFRSADDSDADIETALREALANAVIHGNGEDSSKRVHVVCRCYIDGEVWITVRDEGRGFDRNTVPDPTKPENRLSTRGRGIYLMETLMDEVFFEGGGAIVHLRMKASAISAEQRRAG